MTVRFATAAILSAFLATAIAAPAPVFAQATPPKVDPKAAKPAEAAKTPAKPAAAVEEDDEPSSAEVKKACDAKWKTEKEKTGAKGWKPYFTFMAKCM